MEVSEICSKLDDTSISLREREAIYEEIITYFGFQKNYKATFKAKFNANLLPIFITGFFFYLFAVGILMLSQPWIILVMFIPFIIYGILLGLCITKAKEDRIIEDYKMKIERFMNKIYERNYWEEMENYYLKHFSLEMIGRPISSKLWPTIAASTIPGIIFKLFPKIQNRQIEWFVSILMLVVFVYYFQKIASITRLDKLENIIKEIVRYKDNNRDKFALS